MDFLYFEPDIMIKVFMYLDLYDLNSVEDVCMEWKAIGMMRQLPNSLFHITSPLVR